MTHIGEGENMTKKQKVLEHLQRYGTITSWEAIQEYGATRLSGIIFDLRQEGYVIKTHDSQGVDCYGNKNNYATYEFVSNKQDERGA